MNIWVKKCGIIEPKSALILPQTMRGFFKMEAVKRDGRRRVLADWFPNLITDAGLNLIGTSTNWLQSCKVGTGNATPAVTDTALAVQVAQTATILSSVGAAEATPPYYGSRTNTYRFGEGAAAGNLAEVGIGLTSSTLFSRALILDGGGSPTTITVLSDEFLDVTYQIRLYPPLVDVLDTINISGVDYDFTQRACRVTASNRWCVASAGQIGQISTDSFVRPVAYNGAIGAITSLPAGSQDNCTDITNSTYANLSLFREGTAQWGLSDGNLAGGILSVEVPFGSSTQPAFGVMQIQFDPVIPKDATQVLSLVFRHVWARGSI